MIIKKLNSSNEEVVKEVNAVQALCNEYDNLQGDISIDKSLNFNKDMNAIFLSYEDEKLVSVLSVFAPTINEGEISACTLPGYRNKGYFKKLYDEAVEELNKYKVKDILFVCESESRAGKEAIRKLGGKYEFTEYSMKYMNESTEDFNTKYNLELKTAVREDIEKLIYMHQSIFNDIYENAKGIVESSFNSKERTQYMLIMNNEPVGVASVKKSMIYGLGILPEYQGKGLGKGIVRLLLKELLNNGKQNITLDVNSVNERAFNLYKSMGFKVELAFDYYRKSTKTVER